MDTLTHILSYAGDYQYRFIGGVCRRFKEAYLITFSGDTHTYINAKTEGHARVCVNDFDPLPAGYGPDDYQEYSEAFDQVIALFNSAAKHGSIPTLQYLNDLGYDNPCNSETRQSAARYGHIHILQWCQEMDYPLDAMTCKAAAGSNRLDVLQWCRESNYPWDEETCMVAAGTGQLEVLIWCRENGCPWNSLTRSAAIQAEFWHIVDWCQENGCPPRCGPAGSLAFAVLWEAARFQRQQVDNIDP